MKRKIFYFIFILNGIIAGIANAQSYSPNVSKDSLGVLKERVTMLKAYLKLNELKIKESEEEADVEKLRIKLIAANAKAKESAAKNNDIGKKITAADAKEIEKVAKAAKSDMNDAQKALDSYNKQIKKVESIRSDIRIEEGKLNGRKPQINFD
ncbi:hypothetical protein D9M68_608060 [compost metagenome]